MFLKEFNITPTKKVLKLNKFLKEQFGVSLKSDFPSQKKLNRIIEHADTVIMTLRNSGKKFQLDPEYAKFLGIREVAQTMIAEGMYAESPAYESMCNEVQMRVQELMDKGCSDEEACSMCMHDYRADPNKRWPEELVLPIVLKAARSYVEACNMKHESTLPETDLSQRLLSELAKEIGVEVETLENYDAIEEKLNTFAEVAGKSRDAVVGFLNGLDEDALTAGIQMFGRKIAEKNKFTGARQDAIAQGKDEFEVDGEVYKVTGDTSDEKKQAKKESMFDDIIGEMISEEVDVEQAEVVMAVRALADDIQDQIERIGRMMNEDLPAIADQMRAEMGASQAQSFVDSTTGALSTHLEATKQLKANMDQTVAGLTGEEMVGGLGDTDMDMGDDSLGLGDEPGSEPLDMEEPVDNVPAAAGPEDEPLGRAEI